MYIFTLLIYRDSRNPYTVGTNITITIMKTIEIRIPELGKAVGTTAYVAEKVQHIQDTLKAGKTKQDEPCLTYAHWSDKDKDGNPKRYILMFITNQGYNEGYWNIHENVYSLFPDDTANYCPTYLFPVLTKEAEKYVSKYLTETAELFHEKYNEL